MNFNIIAPAGLKEKYLREACMEYEKRISAFGKLKNISFEPERLESDPSENEIKKALLAEGEKIKKHMAGYSIAMCIEGKKISSDGFSKLIENAATNGYGSITFIIGSSYGIDDSIKKEANCRLSMSNMTFPHQLFRVMLLEQIYRAEMIVHGRKYHK